MNTRPAGGVVRFFRFNAVGAAGLALQLLTLAILAHVVGWHYLPATAAAVATALAHNFAWHVRWTWRDRDVRGRRLVAALGLFVSGNGAVSMLGNLAVMPLLVDVAALPVVAANVVAVAMCGLVNYWLSDQLAFGIRVESREPSGHRESRAPAGPRRSSARFQRQLPMRAPRTGA